MRKRGLEIEWWSAGILVLAAVLRLWALDIKPPHFDEGINGWFTDRMTATGYYDYDPSNYHGPLHFYALHASQTLLGRNLWALRLPAVVAGVLAVWMVLKFGRFFGNTAARVAAAAMAVSPAFVFYSRYSIHESWLVLFNLVMIWGVLGLWRDGGRRALFAVVAGFAGMVLTKETYLIQAGCVVLAFPCLWLWERVVPSVPTLPWSVRRWRARDLAWACGAGIFAVVFFYSGTFLNWEGVAGLWRTFGNWFATGLETGGHEKQTYDLWLGLNGYWVALMARYEWPALAGLLACFAVLFPAPRQVRWMAVYAGGVLLAYSIIPYKTPWCVIALLWPFLLVLGAVVGWIGTRRRLAVAAAGLLIGVSFWVSLRLNFARFTDPGEPYVYVQTFPEMATLTRPVLELARRDGRNHGLRGEVLMESYYPLPWVLGDFPAIAWRGHEGWPEVLDADFVVADAERAGEVEERLRGRYVREQFPLREAQPESVVYFRFPVFAELFPGRTAVEFAPSAERKEAR